MRSKRFSRSLAMMAKPRSGALDAGTSRNSHVCRLQRPKESLKPMRVGTSVTRS